MSKTGYLPEVVVTPTKTEVTTPTIKTKHIYNIPEVTVTPTKHKKGGLIPRYKGGNTVIDNDTVRIDGRIYKVNNN